MFRYVTKIQRTKVKLEMNQIYNSMEFPRLSNHWNVGIFERHTYPLNKNKVYVGQISNALYREHRFIEF